MPPQKTRKPTLMKLGSNYSLVRELYIPSQISPEPPLRPPVGGLTYFKKYIRPILYHSQNLKTSTLLLSEIKGEYDKGFGLRCVPGFAHQGASESGHRQRGWPTFGLLSNCKHEKVKLMQVSQKYR